MGIFDRSLSQIRKYLDNKKHCTTTILYDKPVNWPSGNSRDVVLSKDTACELGSPREESVSSLVWSEESSMVLDGVISVVGPDLPQCSGKSLPFGKIAIVSGSGFDKYNSYDRYGELEGLRYDVDLKGYMLRAASQYQREWSRVSYEALNNGFSFKTLGSSLITGYKKISFIDAAEIIFVTSSSENIKELKKITDTVFRIVSAMNKMIKEMSLDCNDCEYNDVCNEIAGLKSR